MDFAVKRLPIGIEFFDEMIKNQYYYVDKTGMISELLRSGGKVTLFTRPRRFGKSLNMSMLKNFFSLQGDKRIFNELQISRDKQVCEEYMGKFQFHSKAWMDLLTEMPMRCCVRRLEMKP